MNSKKKKQLNVKKGSKGKDKRGKEVAPPVSSNSPPAPDPFCRAKRLGN
jgi:hypothetical protein